MTLINRWYQILQLLVTHKEMTMSELQKQLISSPQTIRKNIELLNDELLEIAQINQNKNGFSLEVQDFDCFETIMSGSLKKMSDFNSASRRISYIIGRLIVADSFISMYDLSDELGVSRGTVMKDTQRLKKILIPYKVEIIGTPNRGLAIRGDEMALRLVHVYYVQDYVDENFLKPETYHLIQDLFGETIVAKQDMILLPKVISITLQRIYQGKSIEKLPTHYFNCVKKSHFFEELIFHLESTYNITLSQVEQDFLAFPLNINANGLQTIHFEQETSLNIIFCEMLREIHRVVVIDIDEEYLFSEMKSHLLFMINRIVFHVELNDLFYGEIEKKYPFAFELARIGLQAVVQAIGCEVSVVEYSYLALYFELALRGKAEQRAKKEIAVVCNTGHGTAIIMKRQLERVLGNDVTITHFSEEEYEKQDLNQYFAIVTTIPLKNIHPKTPVIQLTNLFNDTWLRNEWGRIESEKSQRMNHLVVRVQVLDQQNTYKEYIETGLAILAEEDLIDASFKQRIFEREEKHSTIFDSGIAFPHALNENSSQIILFIGIFSEALYTKDGVVEVMFLLAIPDQLSEQRESELLQLYDQFFGLARDPEVRKELKAKNQVQAIEQWLKEKGLIE